MTDFTADIKVLSVDLQYNGESDAAPSWAIIDLTINGMPAQYCPSLDVVGTGLTIDGNDWRIENWGSDYVFDEEILPAFEEHMQAEWDDDEAEEIKEEVNDAVFQTVNAFLENYDWMEHYELETEDQREAADILDCEWMVYIYSSTIRGVRDGHVFVSYTDGTADCYKLTPEVAKRVIEVHNNTHERGDDRLDNAAYLSNLIDAVTGAGYNLINDVPEEDWY